MNIYLSTKPVSRRLAASAGSFLKQDLGHTSTSPLCAGQLVAKAERRAAAERSGVGSSADAGLGNRPGGIRPAAIMWA